LVGRPLERRFSSRAPEHGLLDPARELEVLIGDPARVVRLQLDPHLGPRDREVRVVVRRLGEVTDAVDEHERARPAVGLVLPADPAVLVVPAGKLRFQLGADLLLGVRREFRACHGSLRFGFGYMTTPPLTGSTMPVRNAAFGDARKSAACATSSGSPQRRSGAASAMRCRSPGSSSAANAVAIQPGARTLTRTSGATLRARLLLKLTIPPLAAANSCASGPAIPVRAWSHDMFRITPPPCSFIRSATSQQQRTVPRRSTARSRSSFARIESFAPPPVRMS